ncbi:MAG TPA: hypothetical protein VF101_04765 [Gaiellaceae bacterium]
MTEGTDEHILVSSTGARYHRRTFLRRAGVGAIAFGGALFSLTNSAKAAGGCGCCNLVYCPPTTSYATCTSVNHYLWGCNGTRHCACCEVKNSSGTYIASAYKCF